MTRPKLLLTSFRPWLKHHQSNASDDLLEIIQGMDFTSGELVFLRQLPVDTKAASAQTIQAIATHQPDVIICCGMAESRQRLTVEAQAFSQTKHYKTSIDLEALTKTLKFTEISYDAGKFVCEDLYFAVLAHLQQQSSKSTAIFVHIPLLTEDNSKLIVQDFTQIIRTFL